jgi:hypothetical protein
MDQLGSKVDRLADSIDSLRSRKAAAILAGARGSDESPAFGDNYTGRPYLKALADWKQNNDFEAMQAAKAILGTSAATGQAIAPNNFVAQIAEINVQSNPYRS